MVGAGAKGTKGAKGKAAAKTKPKAKAAPKPKSAAAAKKWEIEDAVAACADRHCPKGGASFAALKRRSRAAMARFEAEGASASERKKAFEEVRAVILEMHDANTPATQRCMLDKCVAETERRRAAVRKWMR